MYYNSDKTIICVSNQLNKCTKKRIAFKKRVSHLRVSHKKYIGRKRFVQRIRPKKLSDPQGLATLEAFSCFYFLTNLSSNVFLMGKQKQRAVRQLFTVFSVFHKEYIHWKTALLGNKSRKKLPMWLGPYTFTMGYAVKLKYTFFARNRKGCKRC